MPRIRLHMRRLQQTSRTQKFLTDSFSQQVDGYFTLNENIADNIGFRQAFLAYKFYELENGPEAKLEGLEHLTGEQLFTLAYANVCEC